MKKIILLLLTATCCMQLACEKILEKEPTDKLSNEVTFSDLNGAKAALAGAYSILLSTEIYHTNRMVYPDLVSGNIEYSKTTNVKLLDVYGFVQESETCSMNATYARLYYLLGNLNNILYYAPLLPDSATAAVKRIQAETKCLRALAHFDLVRLYARPYTYTPGATHNGIVLNLARRLYNDPLPKRSTVKETYDAMITDLTEAIVLFANTTPVLTGGYTQNMFSVAGAQALLAKVYLYRQDWQKAYDYASLVIANPAFKLMTNQQYVASWSTKTPSAESIFELALEANFAGTTLGNFYGDNGSEQQYAATQALRDLYTSTDVRGVNGLFKSKVISGQTFYFPLKYAGTATNATPIKVIRLSDVYLIRAEAAAQLDNALQAATDLNAIRQRGDLTATPLSFANGAAALPAVLLERRKELAFEGEYFFDMIRYKMGLPNMPFEDYRMVLPIPKSSVNVNPLLEQNLDY